MRVGRHGGELGLRLEHHVLVEVVAQHVERGPGVAAQVLRLGPVVGDRDPQHALVAGHVEDVGELRSPVGADGGQDPLRAVPDERECLGQIHGSDGSGLPSGVTGRARRLRLARGSGRPGRRGVDRDVLGVVGQHPVEDGRDERRPPAGRSGRARPG